MTKKRKRIYKVLRIFGKILLGLFLLIVLLLLFVRSPWGQDIIVQKLINSVSEKTGAQIDVEKAYISFDGDINVEGLYVEDLSGDTLVYSEDLEAHIALWPLISGNGITINSVHWKGLHANILRKDTVQGFNYQFLIDAYAPPEPTSVPQDTTATKFSLGELHFSDFDLSYDDMVLGTHAEAEFQEFNLEMDAFDLQQMKFQVNRVNLSHANIVFSQKKPLPETEDTATAAMPFLSIDKLKLSDVQAVYQSDPEELTAKMAIGKLVLEMPKANLRENVVVVDRLLLKKSDFLVKTHTEQETEEKKSVAVENASGFEWPNWNVSVKEISLAKNEVSYFVNGARPEKGIFNPNAIALKNINLQLDRFSLQNKIAKANLKNLSFTGTSGVHLQRLTFDAVLKNERFSLKNFLFHLNENFVNGQLSAEYASIDSFLKSPGDASLSVKIPRMEIALNTVFMFLPELRNNEYLRALSRNKLIGNVRAVGTLSNIKIPILDLQWGPNTSITAKGSVQNLTDPKNIQFDFPKFDLVSTRNDISKFIEEDSLGISVPKKIKLRSSFHGSPKDITAKAVLLLPEGKINLAGSFKNKNQFAFDINLDAKKINLEELLQNEQLGEITITLKTKGEGKNLNTLDAVLETKIANFSYNGYAFENVAIHGKIKNGTGDIFMDYKDYNLNMELRTTLNLDTISPVFDLHLDLKGADLNALGLTVRDIRTKFDLDARYEGNAQGYDLKASTANGVVVYDNESYLMGDIRARAHIRPDTTSVDISNKILNLKLRSNAGPTDFLTALQEHLRSYISEKIEIRDTIKNPVQLQLDATLSAAPILTEVLLPDIKRLDTVKISVDFDQARRKLDLAVHLPYVNYDGKEIDSLQILVASNKTDFEGSLSFDAVNAGPIAINKTALSGYIANDRLYMDFESYTENDSLLVNVQSVLNAENDSLFFHIDPAELLLNGKKWTIPQGNQLVLAENFIGAKDFRLHRNDQAITIAGDSRPEKNQLSIGFDNFHLKSVLGFLNPENYLATGKLGGNLTIEAPFGNTGIIADFSIRDLSAMEVPLGNLSVNAESLGGEAYSFDLGLSGGDIVLDLVGNYVADSTAAKLDMQLDLEKLELDAIKNFTDGAITKTEGYISGSLQIHGTTTEPDYEGAFKFQNAVFDVATLGATFKIAEETLKVDTAGIYFNDFIIADKNGSNLTVNGTVFTESFVNPAFDLSFQAENFQALNSTAKENELYYGTVVFDLYAKLTGDMNLPVVYTQLDIAPKTNFTYVIPPSEIASISREGIVVFVNKENPDNILTRDTEEETAIVTGVIVNSLINISEGAVFSLIIDKKSGDNLQVKGEGTLNFDISASGRTHLAGRYNINDGHYLLSLYGLVKRRFDIMDGSNISWFGDPLEASLDITAVHSVETSAASLMAAQTGNVPGRFRQELTFLVYLYVDGWLLRPKLSFGIGIAEEDRGSLGGEVVGTIQQLNQQESELNKQVFSLLVLNRFYPQGNDYGARGGALTLARDNLNQLLSDQLNMFSDQLLGDAGINLNFGLDSYTDYQGATPQSRTALEISAEKKFFDDRLIVEVGSAVDIVGSDPNPTGNNPVIENASIVYLLTENGRFRIKGFRKNTFENVIDGQVIINGIALIFQRQFNKFEELWKNELKKLKKEKEGKEKRRKREKEKKGREKEGTEKRE